MTPYDENPLSQALALCPDPQGARIALEGIIKALPENAAIRLAQDKTAAQGLVSLCSASPPLARLLAGDPAAVLRLFQQGEVHRAKDRAIVEAELAGQVCGAGSLEELRRVLRRYRHAAMARIAVRDLCGLAGLEEVMGELSDLASATLEQACGWCFRSVSQKYGLPAETDGQDGKTGFAVMGMGKLGGHELNFCSDIDLIYVYRAPPPGREMTGGGSAPSIDFHDFYTRMAEMLSDAIHRVTEDGMAFRVDLNLRPGGKEGPIAHSLDAAEIYYTVHGETWHRLSLIKATFAAGDREVADSFLKMVRPFVYRRHLDYGSLEEIRWLKRSVESAAGRQSGMDVKLGRGGIRELEFLVQALQIINGGRFPEVREPGTLAALEALNRAGFLDTSVRVHLEEAYRFLRRLEHRIQMAQMRQTHRLPDEEEAMARLALGLGYPTSDALRDALRRHREIVHDHFSRLLEERDSRPGEESLAHQLLSGTMDEAEAANILSGMGFHNVPAALEALKSMSEARMASRLPERPRRLLKGLAPSLLHHAADAPDPDMALVNMDRWIQRLGPRWGTYALLAENPGVIGPLTKLFGSSSFLSRMFIDNPQLMDQLVLQAGAGTVKTRKEMEEDLSRELRAEEDAEGKLAVLRRYQSEETLRTGMMYVFGQMAVEEVSLQLTRLAEACIDRYLSLALKQIDPLGAGRKPGPPPFVIMAMGRLGGGELNFNSDMDLLFIYDIGHEHPAGEGALTAEYFVRLAQRFISLMSAPMSQGLGYRVDMRLRPSGTVGPLVVSLESFRDYYRHEAMLWERQALIRARAAAGNPVLGKQIMGDVRRLAYEVPLPPDFGGQIRRLRHRMEMELARETEDRFNLKTGRGGLVDVEFAVQYLQLKHGGDRPRLREPNTLKAMQALAAEGVLAEDDLRVLMAGFQYLRRVETHLRIVHDFSADELRFDGESAGRIARGLGYIARGNISAVEAMRKEYLETTAGVRKVYETVVV